MQSPPTIQLRDYLIHGIYFTAYGVVKYLPSPIGDVLRYWVSKPFLARLAGARLYEGVTLWYPYRIHIGRDVTLNEWTYVSGFGGVRIGNGVRIGHRTSILSSDHRIDQPGVPFTQAGLVAAETVIEDNVFIGANVTILMGVRIGTGSVVAAGSVVTRNVEPFTVVGGVPAKVLQRRAKPADVTRSE
jgi:acetyltransferase-like isoleucine patch superfamily enzyme